MKRATRPVLVGVWIAALLLLAAGPLAVKSAAAQSAATQPGGMAPTKITSEKMTYSPSGSAVTFEGDVHVNRPDFDLWAGRITVFFTPGGATGNQGALDSGKIDKITASGSVRLEREGRVGLCRSATYLIREGLLKMEGDPTLKDGPNIIKGEVIKLYLKDNRSEVLGGKDKRVEALFFTPKGDLSP